MANELRETPYGCFSADFCIEQLSSLCDPNAGIQTGPFGSQLHQEDYVQIGTPIITVEHLDENRILHANTPKVSDADRDRLSRYQLSKGDIVFSRVGSVDRRALVREKEEGWLFSGRCLRVRPNPTKIDSEYLSYFFGLSAFKQHVRSIAVGATMPSLNTSLLSEIAVPYPPSIKEQRAIAYILSTLDDKIELNRQQNATLEAMVRALFKAWFVDFEPVRAKMDGRWQRGQSLPGLPAHLYDLFPDRLVESELGEIPEGWGVNTIGDFVTIKRGGSPRPIQDFIRPSGIPWVKIADATSAISRFLFQTRDFIKEEGLKKTVLLRNGSLILSNSATPGLPIFLELDACIHDGWLYFPQKQMFNDLYLYQLFLEIRDELVAQGNGSVFTNLKTDILRSQKIVVASESLLRGFDSLAKPLFNKLLALNTESRSLAQLRDTLLPKLISGELRIADADKFIERAEHQASHPARSVS